MRRPPVKLERSVWARDDAIRHFRDMGEPYNAEIIEDLMSSCLDLVHPQAVFHRRAAVDHQT